MYLVRILPPLYVYYYYYVYYLQHKVMKRCFSFCLCLEHSPSGLCDLECDIEMFIERYL